jgi:hypothetical protein
VPVASVPGCSGLRCPAEVGALDARLVGGEILGVSPQGDVVEYFDVKVAAQFLG